jgi:hypothetical protein
MPRPIAAIHWTSLIASPNLWVIAWKGSARLLSAYPSTAAQNRTLHEVREGARTGNLRRPSPWLAEALQRASCQTSFASSVILVLNSFDTGQAASAVPASS